MKKLYISWEQFGMMVEELGNKIKGTFDGIYGLPRGGLPIAVYMSHKFNIPLLLYPTENSLVVDDISDTGKTLQSHKNKKIACLFSTDWTETKPDWFVDKKLNKDEWIVYPWEEDMEKRQTTLDEFE